ncbi:hypothetical protein COM40_12270 [Bacillus wiedmannii]|uniref:hypothetical protein n=1 Tax=Bacillus wiedmannii TaxID=1890302 RepID=UPI000BF3F6BD|nr:hypothetical protein [Bacillus wiedmannii]PGD58136.1 hypothetical protein COM40_12270 [Bacillus wiedmannii]
MNKDIQFLKELQAILKHEGEHDYDSQAAPRFWVIKDYRIVPGNEDYDDGYEERLYNDGDHVIFSSFNDLKEFLEEYFEEKIESNEEFQKFINDESESFDDLWEYVKDNLNGNGFFYTCFVKEESFIAPDTMFLTKEEAKRHLELNNYHYTSKAHTYAMTAWRAPKVERLLNILETFDWESISTK